VKAEKCLLLICYGNWLFRASLGIKGRAVPCQAGIASLAGAPRIVCPSLWLAHSDDTHSRMKQKLAP